MEQNTKRNHFLKNLSSGGLQRHHPKNEAQIYFSKFALDIAGYCFNDYSLGSLNESEIECAKKLYSLNNELMKLN